MQFQLTNVSKLVALAVMTLSAASALAQSSGDTIVSGGWAHIAPQDSSTPLTITSPASFAGPVAGSGASVKNTDTLLISLTHFYTNNWAASLELGVPPTYKLEGTGSIAAVGEIGEAKQWAPVVLGKYFFGEPQSAFRPFLGLGVTHVSYKNISLNSSFQQFIGSKFEDPSAVTTASLDSSWAPVYNAGVSYAINKDWYASLSLSYVKLKTSADLTTATNTVGPVQSTTSLTINPIVAFLSIGYRF